METEYIKNFAGQVLGYIETMPNGDKAAYEFPSRKCLGFYRKAYDHTTNFSGYVLAKGDAVVGLILSNINNNPVR